MAVEIGPRLIGEHHRLDIERVDQPVGHLAAGFFNRHRRTVPQEAAAVNGENGLSRCGRSEEHTSELQSLMRISYAVFCLKKKTSARLIKSHQQKTPTVITQEKN